MNKTSAKVVLVIKWVVLLAVLTFVYLPLIMVVAFSFSTSPSIGSEFGDFTFLPYTKLFEHEKLLDATINTILIGAVSATLATILGTTAAVGIHYMRRKMRGVVDTASQITVVNAEIVTAMAFFVLMIFLRDTIQLPVNFGLGWLIVTHTIITTPYVILSVGPRLKQLNPNLLEASMDLGAGPMRSLITVMLPQLAGAMVSGFALAFTLSLDDFVITNTNAFGSGVQTISTFVYSGILKPKKFPIDSIRALSTIIFIVVLSVLIVSNMIKNKKAKDAVKRLNK